MSKSAVTENEEAEIMLPSDYQDILYDDRPISNRPHMAIEKRAKQFAPFAALKGFEEEVRDKEIIYEQKRILPEEKREELERKFQSLSPGMKITVEYFVEAPHSSGLGQYNIKQGKIDFISDRWIELDGCRIAIADVFDLRGEYLDVFEYSQ